MQTLTARRWRWGAPIAAGAAVAAAAILPGVAIGSDHPSLPPRTAQQLLTDLLSVRSAALSGTVVETARLGLPELPSAGGGSADLSWTNLVTGSHTLRVWLDGAERQRVALIADLAESDVVHDGKQLWVYSSRANEATKIDVPADAGRSAQDKVTSQLPTPAVAAAQALAAITPSTTIKVDATARVAGRPAYQLDLSPKDSRSLITSVRIALDSQTSVPLRVQVFGRDTGTPAFETGFTDITFGAPPASVFHFIPPTGAHVSTATVADVLMQRRYENGAVREVAPVAPGVGLPSSATAAGGRTRTIGDGWTAVVVTDAQGIAGLGGGGGGDVQSTLLDSATRVPGGRLLRTSLVSILLTDDGKLYVGSVDGAALQQVAKTGRPL